MASSIFPTEDDSGVFNPSLWQLPSGKFTREYADLHYLQFPNGQGTQTIPNLNVTGISALGTLTTGTTSISSTLAVTGATTATGLVTANGGVNTTTVALSYSTLPTFTSTQIGYTVTTTASGLNLTTAGGTIYTVTPPVGVYIFNMDITLASPISRSGAQNTVINIKRAGTDLTSVNYGWQNSTQTASVDVPLSVTAMCSVTGSQAITFTWSASIQCSSTYYIKYIRIA